MAPPAEPQGRFDFIRYANCWEDANLLEKALCPAPGRKILSIASGGDNSFCLLKEGARVVAVDLNPTQLAVVELKRAAIRRLDHPAFLQFIGVLPSTDRLSCLNKLLRDLPEQSQLYWRDHATIVEKGLIHAGKFERYFRLFRRWILPLAHSGKTVLRLLEDQGKEERKVFYNKKWDTWRWRAIFHFFFSRRVMGWLGRDPVFFRFVEDSVAERILTRVKHALTELPTHSNPYLTYILTGNFGSALPPYLDPVSYERIKKRLDNLTLVQAPVEEAVAGGGFSGFNLSDIFEYLNPRQCEYIYRALLNAALPGARFAYWNMLVPRSCPAALAHRVTRLEESAQTLFLQDRAFFYSRFVLEEVK